MNEKLDSDSRLPGIEQNRMCGQISTGTVRAQSQLNRLYAPNMRLSKHLRGGNPAIFCIPITSKLLHKLLKLGLFQKGNEAASSLAAQK
jgi:hypothetical protein